jgi:hypothetical protein
MHRLFQLASCIVFIASVVGCSTSAPPRRTVAVAPGLEPARFDRVLVVPVRFDYAFCFCNGADHFDTLKVFRPTSSRTHGSRSRAYRN